MRRGIRVIALLPKVAPRPSIFHQRILKGPVSSVRLRLLLRDFALHR